MGYAPNFHKNETNMAPIKNKKAYILGTLTKTKDKHIKKITIVINTMTGCTSTDPRQVNLTKTDEAVIICQFHYMFILLQSFAMKSA